MGLTGFTDGALSPLAQKIFFAHPRRKNSAHVFSLMAILANLSLVLSPVIVSISMYCGDIYYNVVFDVATFALIYVALPPRALHEKPEFAPVAPKVKIEQDLLAVLAFRMVKPAILLFATSGAIALSIPLVASGKSEVASTFGAFSFAIAAGGTIGSYLARYLQPVIFKERLGYVFLAMAILVGSLSVATPIAVVSFLLYIAIGTISGALNVGISVSLLDGMDERQYGRIFSLTALLFGLTSAFSFLCAHLFAGLGVRYLLLYSSILLMTSLLLIKFAVEKTP